MRNKPVNKVYLFGSYARGQATKKSDIDLLVEFDYTALNQPYDYFDIKFEVEDHLHKKVDLVSAKMLSSSKIAPFVAQDKILIYEQNGQRLMANGQRSDKRIDAAHPGSHKQRDKKRQNVAMQS